MSKSMKYLDIEWTTGRSHNLSIISNIKFYSGQRLKYRLCVRELVETERRVVDIKGRLRESKSDLYIYQWIDTVSD